MGDQYEEMRKIKEAEMLKSMPDGQPEFKMPTIEEMLKVLETMDLSDGDKENLKKDLLKMSVGSDGGFGGLLKNKPAKFDPSFYDYTIFFVLVAIIVLIFGKKIFYKSTQVVISIQIDKIIYFCLQSGKKNK